MKRFKSIFYGVYLLFFAVSAFIAFFYEDMVLRWGWDGINTWTGLLRFVLKLGGIGLVLFVIEIIVENIHLYAKDRKIKSLEREVQDIKAKLYDLNQSKDGVTKDLEDAVSNTSLEESKDNNPEHQNKIEQEENPE